MTDIENQAKTRLMPSVRPIDPMWNSAEDLRITDAAALIAGYDPTAVKEHRSRSGLNWPRSYARYPAVFTMLCDAITNGRLNANLRYLEPKVPALTRNQQWALAIQRSVEKTDGAHVPEPSREIDWTATTITRDELVRWLMSRGIKTGFFFEKTVNRSNFLDPNHPRYAPRMVAALRAWLAVTDVVGTSPKQALMKWLREHAADYGLIDDDGKLNETGIEEIAKVANWDTKGGAPSTPSRRS